MKVWREVLGYEGLYQVSEDGAIMNIVTGRILRQKFNTSGYLQVGLRRDGKTKWMLVSRVVGMAFVPCSDFSLTISHDDNNKLNNHYTNLSWMTLADNRRKATTDGLIPKGTMRKDAKLNEVRVICILFLAYDGQFSHESIAKFLGVSRTVVSEVISRKRWQHEATSLISSFLSLFKQIRNDI